MKTRMILVGGFLGAGKTTLLLESARKLIEQGKRVGLITNDQASSLVDTAFLQRSGGSVVEVSGSCFCCNFNGFTDAITYLRVQNDVDIIIAEPVGSCTDLSATIMQPLKQTFKNELILSPLTVLVDPARLQDILDGGTSGLHPSAAYIVKKQLDEADMIVITKTDVLSSNALEVLKKKVSDTWAFAKVFALSAQRDEGLDVWLNEAKSCLDVGTHLTEVDYDIYAQGEAVLGWLNMTVSLQGHAIDWDSFALKVLEALAQRFDASTLAVGHVKVLIETEDQYVIGNLTGKKESLSIRGSAGIGNQAKMILNARVEMSPEELERTVKEVVSTLCSNNAIMQTPESIQCLSPGRPNPTYRYDYVVQ